MQPVTTSLPTINETTEADVSESSKETGISGGEAVSGNGPSSKNLKKKKIKISEDLELQSPFASFVGAFIAHLERGVSPMQIREKLRKKK